MTEKRAKKISNPLLEHSVFAALCFPSSFYGAKFPDGALGSLVVRRASCRGVARAPAGWRLPATARPNRKSEGLGLGFGETVLPKQTP